MFNDGNFAEGKCEWPNLFSGRFNLAQSVQLDLWGNDEDLFISRLYSALETSFTSTCPSPRCPSGVKKNLFQSNYFKVHVNGFIFLLGYMRVIIHQWGNRYNCMYLLVYPFYCYCLCVMRVMFLLPPQLFNLLSKNLCWI